MSVSFCQMQAAWHIVTSYYTNAIEHRDRKDQQREYQCEAHKYVCTKAVAFWCLLDLFCVHFD